MTDDVERAVLSCVEILSENMVDVALPLVRMRIEVCVTRERERIIDKLLAIPVERLAMEVVGGATKDGWEKALTSAEAVRAELLRALEEDEQP